MTVCCPECFQPVSRPPHARDGRCNRCRPSRRHSQPRTDSAKSWQDFVDQHEARTR